MEKINRGFFWTMVASESIHIFCCVLPTIFSVLSLMAGFGMIATMPGFIEDGHNLIHVYEIPMIIISGVILTIGWGVYIYSRRISCRTQGSCCHEPCAPKKDRTRLFMTIATLLFVVNLCVYFIFHRGFDEHAVHQDATSAIMHDHEHDHHNH